MFRPEEDGSFRVEDVPAGKYMLSVQLFKPADDGQRRNFGQPQANLTYAFSVPEIPGGRSDEALDLGTVTLQSQSFGRIAARSADSQPAGGIMDTLAKFFGGSASSQPAATQVAAP
jgi:hypothetical protein